MYTLCSRTPHQTAAVLAAILLSASVEPSFAQAPMTTEERVQSDRRRSVEAERNGLAAPFRGVTTNGTVVPGLFEIRSTGVSTAPVREAAAAFLASLTPQQRTRTAFPVDDPGWRRWMNQHFYVRQGVSLGELSAAQRERAIALLRASLSAKGLRQTQDIMRLNTTLAELNGNNFAEYGEGRYYVTLMGQPSATEPWGWQLDGHHLIINYFVLGDQVVMTPTFMGSEPVSAASGRYAGTRVLRAEETKGLTMINALDARQRAVATIGAKTGANTLSEAFRDNLVLDYAGIRATDMTPEQRNRLIDLIAEHVGNMRDGHAAVRMAEVRRHLDGTYFAWIGGTEPNSVFYYRVHSPVILIEFDHQRPIGIRGGDRDQPRREHIHSIVRTPNGNDYGKDLLRQHYEQHPAPHRHP